MKEEKKTAGVSTRADRAEIALRIDDVSGTAATLFRQAGSFAQELMVAEAVVDLRALLTPEIMKPVMALMNTDLGFATDRDPRKPDKEGKVPSPYSMEVVRECFIESKLRGFHVVGNEFNIIAGKFYAAKNGFARKLADGKSFPGLTDFKDFYEVPRTVGDRGAIVKCRATWKVNGVADSLEREFPIKVNSFMGSDAILGKAERKLKRAVHDRLMGIITPEAEVGEDAVAAAKPAQAETVKAEDMFGGGKPTQAPAAAPETEGGASIKLPPNQQELATLTQDAGCDFNDFRAFVDANSLHPDPTSWADWSTVPKSVVRTCITNRERYLKALVDLKGGGQ